MPFRSTSHVVLKITRFQLCTGDSYIFGLHKEAVIVQLTRGSTQPRLPQSCDWYFAWPTLFSVSTPTVPDLRLLTRLSSRCSTGFSQGVSASQTTEAFPYLSRRRTCDTATKVLEMWGQSRSTEVLTASRHKPETLTHPLAHAHPFTACRARLWLDGEQARLTSEIEAFIHTCRELQRKRGGLTAAHIILGSVKCGIAAQ